MLDLDTITMLVWDLLKPLGLQVYKYRHPKNAKGTFIVINPLAVVSTRMGQDGAINCNIYTDNIVVDGDASQPMQAEINRVTKLILPILEGDWLPSKTKIDIGSMQQFPEGDSQTLTNIKLNFSFIKY